MIIPRRKIHLYKKDPENDYSWSSDYEDITDSVSISESSGIESRKDVFSFRVINRINHTGSHNSLMGLSDELLNRFKIRDNIKIYLWNGNEPADINDSLIMDGLIDNLSYDTNEDTKVINIGGANRTEILLNNMVPTVVGSSSTVPGQTPAEIITGIIQKVNSFNTGKNIAVALDSEPLYGEHNGKKYLLSTAGSIQSKHGNGTAFEYIQYSQNWKNAYEQIEELSSPEQVDPTGSFRTEGGFIFDIVNKEYVTPEGDTLHFNVARWRNKPTAVTGSIIETTSSGSGFSTSKLSKGTFDVINAAIIAGGNNLTGGGVLRVVYNPKSMGRLGARWKFIPLVKTFDSIYNQEAPNITDADGDRFPDSYPYTFKTVNSGSVVANNSEFNNTLVGETSIQIKDIGQGIVDLLGDARFKAEYELYWGSTDFLNGQLYYLQSPSFGWYGTTRNPGKNLRLVNQSHTFDLNGWKTTLFFEEDEKVVSDLVNP